jgi:two-component sensor histidine kinase
MSLVHEKLYQSRSLVKVNFGEYIDFLADHLLQLCQDKSDQVRLEMDLKEVQLDINSAVPSGLLINEVIVNAINHAFPDGRKRVVQIGLKPAPGETIEVRVADDGIGFPEGMDFRKSESFGTQLINLLAKQLEATVELDRTGGTAFTVTFRELKYAPRI